MEATAEARSEEAVQDAVEALKVQLAKRVTLALEQRGLTQAEAQRVTGVNRAEFSRIRSGHLQLFKLDRLIRMLIMLGEDVHILMAEDVPDPA